MKFLKAHWQDLVMVNWKVNSSLLQNYVPQGTILDSWNDQYFLSLVAFKFLDTRLLGVPIPFHINFVEINLRFYVRREVGKEIRRGVVFIKEIVPRFWIAYLARFFYNENYFSRPTSAVINRGNEKLNLSYGWKERSKYNSIRAQSKSELSELLVNSEQEFISEHYWGYCRQKDGNTLEYQVEHPRWQIASLQEFSLDIDFAGVYGNVLGKVLSSPPASAFYANGSKVSVGFGSRF